MPGAWPRHGVGRTDARFELRDDGGWIRHKIILVEGRNPIQLEDFDNSALGRKLLRGPQRGPIVGFLAETAGDSQNFEWRVHICFNPT